MADNTYSSTLQELLVHLEAKCNENPTYVTRILKLTKEQGYELKMLVAKWEKSELNQKHRNQNGMTIESPMEAKEGGSDEVQLFDKMLMPSLCEDTSLSGCKDVDRRNKQQDNNGNGSAFVTNYCVEAPVNSMRSGDCLSVISYETVSVVALERNKVSHNLKYAFATRCSGMDNHFFYDVDKIVMKKMVDRINDSCSLLKSIHKSSGFIDCYDFMNYLKIVEFSLNEDIEINNPYKVRLLLMEDIVCELGNLCNNKKNVSYEMLAITNGALSTVGNHLAEWVSKHNLQRISNLSFDPGGSETTFFDKYGYHGTSFEQSYRCYHASFIVKPQIKSGDKIIMSPSAVDRLASLHIDYPMLFELRNDVAERASHCGVLEFITEEGVIYMAYWMMDNLLLQEGDIVKVKNVKLESFTLEHGATNFGMDRKKFAYTSVFAIAIQAVDELSFEGIAIVMNNDVREKITTMKQEVKPKKAPNLMTKVDKFRNELLVDIFLLLSSFFDPWGQGSFEGRRKVITGKEANNGGNKDGARVKEHVEVKFKDPNLVEIKSNNKKEDAIGVYDAVLRRANAMLHQTIGTLQLHNSSRIHCQDRNNSMGLLLKDFKVEVRFSKGRAYSFGGKKFNVIQASVSQNSIFDPGIYGYKPLTMVWDLNSIINNLREKMKSINQIHKLLKEQLQKTQRRMKQYATRKAQTENLLEDNSSSSFSHTTGDNRVELPENSGIHKVFHVSLHKKRVGDSVIHSKEPPELSGDEQLKVYSVIVLDKLMVKRPNKTVTHLLVPWSKLGMKMLLGKITVC
ncbi:hypothetical protein GQ457_08G018830 [Hibiscus cannabinus]